MQREDTLLTFLPAPLIRFAKFTVSIFPGTLSSLRQPECMPSCEIKPERSKFVRNLFLLKSMSFIKTKAEKQKQKKKKPRNSRGRGRLGPRRHFTTCEATTLPYMAPCLPAAANQCTVPSHVMCHEGSTAISLFRKSLLPPQSPVPCVACQMCLQNVSSGLAFVHKVISAGKKVSAHLSSVHSLCKMDFPSWPEAKGTAHWLGEKSASLLRNWWTDTLLIFWLLTKQAR